MSVKSDRVAIKGLDEEVYEVLLAPSWGNVQGKPETFSPQEHTHPWSEIQDPPDTYPPAAHTHTAGEVKGTLTEEQLPVVPASKGGTGRKTTTSGYFLRGAGSGAMTASSPEKARKDMGAAAAVEPVTVTLTVDGWSGTGPWTQTAAIQGVTAADSQLHVYPVPVADAAAKNLYARAYTCLDAAESVDGGIRFTCAEKPATNFEVSVQGVRV